MEKIIKRPTWSFALLTLAAVLNTRTWLRAQEPGPGARRSPTAVQLENRESTSKEDDVQIPEANPARPTVSNPAHIPPVGYVQFEQGFLQANGSPAGLSRQFSLVEVVRLAVHPRWMAEFVTQPFAASSVPGAPGREATTRNDPGDLALGAQGLLVKEKGKSPTVALAYLHRVRGGSAPDLDIGSFSQSAVLLVSGDLGGFHYDGNAVASEQVAVPVRRAQIGQTLSVTHDLFPEPLRDRLEVTGELWHFTQPLVTTTRHGTPSARSNAVGTLWVVTYAVRPNIVLDSGFDHGLTSTSTAWQGFAGFTYLLPHRLWRDRREQGMSRSGEHVHRR